MISRFVFVFTLGAHTSGAMTSFCAQPDRCHCDQLRVRALLSASVLTQATDVECECDGLRNYDRSAKFSDAQAAQVRAAFERLIAGG
jgi:hypothetical protein